MINKYEIKLMKGFKTVGTLCIMTAILFIGTVLIGIDFFLNKSHTI